MKTLLFVLVVTSLASCVSLRYQGRRPASSDRISFDVHLHVDFSNSSFPVEPSLETFLTEGAERALLLSQGYLFDPRYPEWGSLAARDEANRRTALLVSQHPDRFRGLCGVGYMWEDADSNLATCLRMPGMIGAKLRFQRGDQLTDKNISANLLKLLKGNQGALKVVLIHMPNEAYGAQTPLKELALQRDQESLLFMLDRVAQYPKIHFILAHSLYEEKLLETVVHHFPNGAPENLWLDTSAAFAVRSINDDPTELATSNRRKVALWRKLGLNKVLYGSDSSLGGKVRSLEPSQFGKIISYRESLEELTSLLTRSPDLTAEELKTILGANGKAFADLVF